MAEQQFDASAENSGDEARDEARQIRIKRLTFRSFHRGTREMDLLLGSFAERTLSGLSDTELDAYEALLGEQDPDLYDWIIGRTLVPAEFQSSLMEKLQAHRFVVRPAA